MAVKEVVCEICKSRVTKRQTLKFGNGRACREHAEVQAVIREKEKKEKEAKTWAKINENLQVITVSSAIRVWQKQTGLPMELVMFRALRNLKPEVKQRVREEVEKRGEMSDAEVTTSVLAWLELMKKE